MVSLEAGELGEQVAGTDVCALAVQRQWANSKQIKDNHRICDMATSSTFIVQV